MKSARYFLFSLFFLSVAYEAAACLAMWYTPNGYNMFRIYDYVEDQSDVISGTNAEYTYDEYKNCEAWQKLTYHYFSISDIHYVVYKMSLDELERARNNPDETYENEFLEHITKYNEEILDFLLLAKTNEHIRSMWNSRWYYPSMKTGACISLEEVAEKALSSKTAWLRDRYLLQAIRALFTLGQYDRCIQLWDSEVSLLPKENLMRQYIEPYIAGAQLRLNRSEEAFAYFAKIGDVESLQLYSNRIGKKLSTIDALELVCKYNPDCDYVNRALENYIYSLEPKGYFFMDSYSHEPSIENLEEFNRLYSLCLNIAKSGKSKNPAKWYYTAAFLSDLKGDTANASNLLKLAEKQRTSKFLSESIKVFRFYLDAKLLPYDSAYENKLFTQLKWLDTQIVKNLDQNVKEDTAIGISLRYGYSYYYWNDMMRRILLAVVCPRMLKAGKTTRALQLANMASNRLLNIVDQQYCDNNDYVYMFSPYDNSDPKQKVTMQEYRYSDAENKFDYRNHFFEMIDSIGIDAAVKYVNNVEHPKSEFDIFLNKRGYTGDDYLYDIVGTQYMRNMNYTEALKYLEKVSYAYKNHLNVTLDCNPFSFNKEYIDNSKYEYADFKYYFAKEMHSLEQGIENTTDLDRKARMMVRYALGLRNSFGFCWELTQYYRGEVFFAQACPKRDWENDNYTKRAIRKSQQLISKACSIASDEVVAELHLTLLNYKTIVDKYPDSSTAYFVKGQCDNLHDYYKQFYF